MKVDKQVTLKLTGYEIHGESILNHWGGGQGIIEMDKVKFPPNKRPTRREIAKEVNDGQFGCESIDSATVYLDAVYGYSFRYPVDEYVFEKEELTKARRGV